MKRFLNVWNNEEGSELVEFVFIVPVLMLVLAYMLCFCQVIYASQVALNASNAGVRVAVLQNNQSSALANAQQAAASNVANAGMGIQYLESGMDITDVYDAPSSWRRGNICNFYVRVEVDTIMPMGNMDGFRGNSRVTKVSHMMIESD